MAARLVAVAAVEVAVAGKTTVRRNVLIGIVLIAIFLCGYVALVLSQGQGEDEVAKTTEGKIVCLSKTGPGPHTMECAIGLETDTGAYMLKDMSESEMAIAKMDREVIVKGETSPRSEADTHYAINGAIRVEEIKEK